MNFQSSDDEPSDDEYSDDEIAFYKAFIDGLVDRKASMSYIMKVFSSGEWQDENFQKLKGLPEEIKSAVLALMLKAAKTATHDCLVYLVDNDVRIVADGRELPDRPFGTSLYEDWSLREQKLPWWDEEP